MNQPPQVLNSRWSRLYRLYNFFFRPLKNLEDYSQRYGDIFQFGNSPTPTVLLSNPQAIATIFQAPPDIFDIGKNNSQLKFLLGDTSIVLVDGEVHQRKRKLLMPSFHGECLQSYSQSIVDITNSVCDNLQVNKSFHVRHYMQEITLKVIIKLVFGIDTENQRYRELQQILTSLLDAIGSPLSSSLIFFQSLQKDWGKFSPWGRYLRLRQRLKELLDTEIQLRRTNPQLLGKDILSLLITTTDTAGNNLSDREIQDELMTLFVAGHETTASALVWELYWVHYLPNVKNKLLQELSQLDQNSNLNQILKLPYLDGIVAETLRIYPVVPGIFTRKLKSNLKVLDYEFMTGTSFVISIHGTHRREDIYPQAKEFKPERFLEKQYPPHEYFPFGGGSRRCIGSALAQMEMKLVLITMLSRYQLKLTSDRPIKPVRRGLTFAAPNNFKMVVVQDLHNSRN